MVVYYTITLVYAEKYEERKASYLSFPKNIFHQIFHV